MRSHYRAIAIAAALAGSSLVYAQSGGTAAGTGGNNPLARGDDVFSSSPMNRGHQSSFGNGGLDNPFARRAARKPNNQVTPVPEPSQWAMMAAGLALVGFIVRRNSRKSRDAS